MNDIREVLNERGINYGEFRDFAEIARMFKSIAHHSPSWERMSGVQKEGMDMVLHKVSRILNGNPNFMDSWVDIIGYAQLVVDDLNADNRR